jgi:hypothetical protein
MKAFAGLDRNKGWKNALFEEWLKIKHIHK